MTTPGLASIEHGQNGGPGQNEDQEKGRSKRPIFHVGDGFDPDDQGKEKGRDIGAIFRKISRWKLVTIEPELLDDASQARERAKGAPHAGQKEPGEDHRCPPDAPGDKEHGVAGRVLRPKKPHQNENRKEDVSKGSNDGKIAPVLEEIL